jgi:hypothetical protein
VESSRRSRCLRIVRGPAQSAPLPYSRRSPARRAPDRHAELSPREERLAKPTPRACAHCRKARSINASTPEEVRQVHREERKGRNGRTPRAFPRRSLYARFPPKPEVQTHPSPASSWFDAPRGLAVSGGREPTRITDTPQFFELKPCENRKAILYRRTSQKARARLAGRARADQAKGEGRKILIWNRCNPLISPDSDE